jgi:hypothetical protein
MASRILLALCALLAPLVVSPDASANGRGAGTSTIRFRDGMEKEIAAGMTFGLLLSRDGGATWSWMCEEAVGYGGTYDPDYEYTASGALFATTFTGMQVMRNGCMFAKPSGTKFVSTLAQGPDGHLYYGAAETPSTGNPGDAQIYRSIDDGMTWAPGSVEPGQPKDWWQSLEVAPSDPMRLYLAGYRFVGGQKDFLLLRSINGGDTWQPLPITAFTRAANSTLEIAGISHTNADIVFARIKLEDNTISDAIYRSTDGGMNWTRVLGMGGGISLLVRRSGEVLAATQALGAMRSPDGSLGSWTALVNPPHINCLSENSVREVWACTQNYGGMQAPSDGYGIMKTTDLATWTPVLKYQEMKAPVACAQGTVQKERCDNELWCGLCAQLGCNADRPACTPAVDAPEEPPEDKGCCKNSATPAPGALLLVLGIGVLLLRRPRARRR